MSDSSDLVRMIVEKVSRIFKEADAPEDDQANNITEVKEVI